MSRNLNLNIESLYQKDQEERFAGTWSAASDADRRKRAFKIIRKYPHFVTGSEWFYYGHLYHHGSRILHSVVALVTSIISLCFGYSRARNLLALSLDRLCMKLHIPQIFGTQIYRKSATSPWVLYKTLPMSDRVRKFFLCESVAEMEQRVKQMNENT